MTMVIMMITMMMIMILIPDADDDDDDDDEDEDANGRIVKAVLVDDTAPRTLNTQNSNDCVLKSECYHQ